MVKTKKETANKLSLDVESRLIIGKKLNSLRNQGLIPANIYGTDFKSQSIQIKLRDFIKAYKTAKETGIVYLKLGGQEIPSMIRNIQRHPVLDKLLHVDFRKVDLTKKIQTEVPIEVIGVSEAVTQKGGVLLTLSESLNVEALPEKIPSTIKIDISVIKDFGQEIKVSTLPKSADYEIKEEPEKIVISVVEHKEESITPETTAAAQPEVITEKETVEGEAPAEPGAPVSKSTTPAPAEKQEKEKKK